MDRRVLSKIQHRYWQYIRIIFQELLVHYSHNSLLPDRLARIEDRKYKPEHC